MLMVLLSAHSTVGTAEMATAPNNSCSLQGVGPFAVGLSLDHYCFVLCQFFFWVYKISNLLLELHMPWKQSMDVATVLPTKFLGLFSWQVSETWVCFKTSIKMHWKFLKWLDIFFHGCGNSATVEVSLTFSFIVGSNPPESWCFSGWE